MEDKTRLTPYEFIDPLSDFGFKNLFGKGEKSKENLKFLLNEVLKDYPGMSPIVDIRYDNNEQQGDSPERKSIRFDVHCKTQSGETFVVEMQNENERHLKQRLIFYLCQTVTEQDSRIYVDKPWDYDFPRVIVVMFCNFIDKEIDDREVNHFGILNLETFREFGHHVGLTVIQLPLFPKEEKDCETTLEKIIYTMTHMETIIKEKKNPFSETEGDFYDRVRNMSTTAALTQSELHAYHQWLKVTNDDRLRLARAEEKGLAEGEAKGRAEGEAKGRAEGISKGKWISAKKMWLRNYSLEEISEITEIPVEELKQKLK